MSWAKVVFLAVATAVGLHAAAPAITMVGSFTINNTLGGNFDVNQPWTLKVTGGQPDAAFVFCAAKNEDAAICIANFGRTSSDGSWTKTGTFDNYTVGSWVEWIQFPSGARSNRIAFTVAKPLNGSFRINGAWGGNFTPGQTWTLSVTGAPSNSTFDICAEYEGLFIGCSAKFGTTDANGTYSTTGNFDSSAAGGWKEWLKFPTGYDSNPVSFTIGTTVAYLAYGYDFGPFINGQDPTTGFVISPDQIRQEISAIAPYVRWLRSYGSTNGLENVGQIARAFGLKVAVGVWLNNNSSANELEISGALAQYNSGNADMIVVGSEVLLRGDLTETQLIAYIKRIKQAAPNATVTTADTYSVLANHPNVVAACDVIAANFFPYWDGIKLGQSVASLHANYQLLQARYPDKEIIVSETGWPSGGNSVGSALPSPTNASDYFLNFASWAQASNRKYFYFEAYDESWKAAAEGPQGALWGTWNSSGVLKPGMQRVFNGQTVADNWSNPGNLYPGGPGTPSIAITHIPALGSTEFLSGQVLHVDTTKYYVAVFLHVNGGWWTKPYWISPRTTILSDGSWTCNVVTGGIDGQADSYAAFVLPTTFDVPLASGGGLPSLGSVAVAQATVNR